MLLWNIYGYDGHRSTRFLTDSTGTITDTYTYDAFGNLSSQTGATPNDYLYSGEQYDSNLGFYYLRARYLNPESGRFWTMDSYEGSSDDPLTLHKYTYANNNAVNKLDPSGKITSTVEAAEVGQLVSALVNVVAYLLINEVIPRIKQKIDEDLGLYVYRRGNPNSMKTTALYREDDWKSGLSFSTKRPNEKHLKFSVKSLLFAGFAVFPDGGRAFTNIIDGGPLDDRTAGPDHVSVFIPDRTRWDAWYNAEKDNTTQNPFVPNSEETRTLYSLREFEFPF